PDPAELFDLRQVGGGDAGLDHGQHIRYDQLTRLSAAGSGVRGRPGGGGAGLLASGPVGHHDDRRAGDSRVPGAGGRPGPETGDGGDHGEPAPDHPAHNVTTVAGGGGGGSEEDTSEI